MAFTTFGANSRDSTISDSVFKVILIGDHDVGKSSILTRFLDGNFSEEKVRTYGSFFLLQASISRGR